MTDKDDVIAGLEEMIAKAKFVDHCMESIKQMNRIIAALVESNGGSIPDEVWDRIQDKDAPEFSYSIQSTGDSVEVRIREN